MEQRINLQKAKIEIIKEEIEKNEEKLIAHEEEKSAIQEAKVILQIAAKETQKSIEGHFSKIVTQAMQIVFDDPYVFQPEFVERRNKTECDLWLVKNEEKLRPRFAVGGGVMDVIAFATRLAYWKLEKSSSVIILDEPFKNLSATLIPKAAEILEYLSEEFNLQMIITTHIDEISEKADKKFIVEQGNIWSE